MVRLARLDDIPALTEALVRSFHDDPVPSWSLPSDRRRPGQLRRFYRQRLRSLIPDETVLCDEERRGAAIWTAPDRWQMSLRDIAEMRIFTRRSPLFLIGAHKVDEAHPRQPHLYLHILGVSPEAQGSGLGSALMAPMLERCDREGVGAYLESSKERNIAFYERHGFRVTGEQRFPRGGPTLWFMWRDPR